MTLVSYVPKKVKNSRRGVDHVDQLAQCNNTAPKSRRWPLAIFFHLLNISMINASVIHQLNSAFELLQPYLQSSLECKSLTKKLQLQNETQLPNPGLHQNKKRNADFILEKVTERPKQFAANVQAIYAFFIQKYCVYTVMQEQQRRLLLIINHKIYDCK
ncbi:hypothetical protein T4E_6442 [Trichinella pseudospiralis]|uniref:PiggyBac transposable element-derived protein domain-containing protein n=1 Tax=Trichinella pseudospiralis TaxID=6337 RepID=A0A0V0YM51_TRIPS|nr:hypothetical protein T4E_6442 [Trichinella pseudospiralis]